MSYRAYYYARFASAILVLLVLVAATVSAGFLFLHHTSQVRAASVGVPEVRVETPEESEAWTLNHVKHAWLVNMTPDSESNLTLLLQKIEERGYAVSYCYGITLVWSWVMNRNHIAHPVIVITTEKDTDRWLHAVGLAYWHGKLYPFYARGEEDDIVMIQDPYANESWWNGLNLVQLLLLTRKFPPPHPVTLDEYIQYLEPKDPVWTGPLIVRTKSNYVKLEYRCLKQTDIQPHQFAFVVNPSDGVQILQRTANSFEPTQKILLKLKTNMVIVRAGDWWTLIIKS